MTNPPPPVYVENPQTPNILSALATAIDADVLHLSERAKKALSNLNAALARQSARSGNPPLTGVE